MLCIINRSPDVNTVQYVQGQGLQVFERNKVYKYNMYSTSARIFVSKIEIKGAR